MSRSIKFRAWVTEITGESFMLFNVTPYHILDGGWGTADKIYGFKDGEQRKAKTDTARFELMQFIGLQDKNGKEIYEGDIVRFKDVGLGNTGSPVLIGVWEWADQGFKPVVKGSKSYGWNPKSMEVIGNIHDNPELLEGGELND